MLCDLIYYNALHVDKLMLICHEIIFIYSTCGNVNINMKNVIERATVPDAHYSFLFTFTIL